MTRALLEQLRDIHLPSPISIWPLAIGWYFLMGMSLAAIIVFLLIRWRKDRLKRMVLAKLEQLAISNQEDYRTWEELSVLLKRAALVRYPRQEVAGKHGEEWLNFLDKTAGTQAFSQGVGRLLTRYPYQGRNKTLPPTLFALVKDWVQKNL